MLKHVNDRSSQESLTCCRSLLYNISSLKPSLSSPTPISSRNLSGSGSCRSMEIWVRTVYVIAASINALLICLGLQPSIHIIHLHTQPSQKLLLHVCVCAHTHRKKNGMSLRSRKKLKKSRKQQQEGQQTEQVCPPLCLCSAPVSDHHNIDWL